jgi:hypothetical protein
MRVCVRLAVLAGLLVAVAMGLIALRTDVHQSGHRLHALFREKRSLERRCCGLELRIARLRSQQRLKDRAADLRRRADSLAEAGAEGTDGSGAPGRTVDDRSPPGPP